VVALHHVPVVEDPPAQDHLRLNIDWPLKERLPVRGSLLVEI
jgi:hypothetical protein